MRLEGCHALTRFHKWELLCRFITIAEAFQTVVLVLFCWNIINEITITL